MAAFENVKIFNLLAHAENLTCVSADDLLAHSDGHETQEPTGIKTWKQKPGKGAKKEEN